MSNYDEKIYDLLNEKKEPLTIGQINSLPEFSTLSRQELSAILKKLQKSGDLYRKVVDGKAYYSADPAEGEGLNPNQVFIQGTVNRLNNALNGGNDKQSQMIELLKSLSRNSSEEKAEPNIQVNTSVLNFTFNNRNTIETENYSIMIPDGFRVEKNIDDRDFVAWIPSEDHPDDYDFGVITLYAGQTFPDGGMSLLPSNRLRALKFDSIASQLQKILSTASMFEEQTKLTVDTEETVGSIFQGYADTAVHSNAFMLVSRNIQTFRLQFMDVTKKEMEQCGKAAQSWLKTLVSKIPFENVQSIDQPEFREEALSSKYLEDLKSCVKANETEIEGYRNEWARNELNAYKSNPGASLIQLKKKLRQMTEQMAQEKSDLYGTVIGYLVLQSEKTADDGLLDSFYSYVTELLNNVVPYVELDDEIIKADLPAKEELKKLSLTPEIQKIQEEKQREEAAKKAAAEKAEAERIAAEKAEAERRAAIRKAEREEKTYHEASDLVVKGDIKSLERAVTLLETIDGREDAEQLLKQTRERVESLKAEELQRRIDNYEHGCELLEKEDATIADAEEAITAFENAKGYKNTARKIYECKNLIKNLKAYNEVVVPETSADLSELEAAVLNLKRIGNFRDTNERIGRYEQQIQRIRKENEQKALAEKKRKNRNRTIIILVAALAVGLLAYFFTVVHPKQEYNRAVEALQNEQYESAKAILIKMADYEDAQDLIEECERGISYNEAVALFESGNFNKAKDAFESLGSYKESAAMVLKCEAENYIDLANRMLSEEIYNENLIETMDNLKALGLSEYEPKYNEILLQTMKGAFEKNKLDTAEAAMNSITDPSLIDSSFKAELDKALAAKKAAEEEAARKKAIADAYQELCDITVSDSASIKRAEELLDVLPSDYMDVADFVKVFNYYKPYLG